MLFVYSAIDCHDKSAIRTKNNPAHVKYVYEHGMKIIHAGPLVCDDGLSPIGTLIIVEAGLFSQISLVAWDKKTD